MKDLNLPTVALFLLLAVAAWAVASSMTVEVREKQKTHRLEMLIKAGLTNHLEQVQ